MMLSRIVSLCIIALLTACSGKYDAVGTSAIINQGSEFDRALQEDYAALAVSEKAEADWADTREFVKRAIMASNGQVFAPELIAFREIPAHALSDLKEARLLLMGVLSDEAMSKMPKSAASAQSAFDCWMQEQEEDRQPSHISACRSVFETAIAELETLFASDLPPLLLGETALPVFEVFFDLNSIQLSLGSENVLKAVIDADQVNNPETIQVIGYTDFAGTMEYNIILSQRRAEAVYNFLVSKGVNPEKINVEAYGEERPKPGVLNSNNPEKERRVEILLK